jgi:AcrR family transcriptional regulator
LVVTVGEPRREAILAAACRVIGRVGIDRLRMSDVAEEAGVSTALVHYYCATRSDLLVQAFQYADERATKIEGQVPSDLPVAERIEQLLVVYLDEESEIYENWVLWREMTNHALFDPALRPALEESYREWVEGLVEIMTEGQAAGQIGVDVDTESAAWRLTAFVEGLGPFLLFGTLDRDHWRELIKGAVALELGLQDGARAPSR